MTWLPLIETDFLPDNDVVGVDRAEGSFAIYKVDGTVYVTDNLCTHGNARLCDGFLEGVEIECPLHQGRFDIRSGAALCAPLVQPLAHYPVKIENNFVCIELQAH
jgi:naphthalene 1,2-dioxygenase ferredoxin component